MKTISDDDQNQVVRIGLAPNRIDLLVNTGDLNFEEAWSRRITGSYGGTLAYWIDLDSLIEIKKNIDSPRHQDDFRVLLEVKKMLDEKANSANRGKKSKGVPL